jgi:hypothetical protein
MCSCDYKGSIPAVATDFSVSYISNSDCPRTVQVAVCSDAQTGHPNLAGHSAKKSEQSPRTVLGLSECLSRVQAESAWIRGGSVKTSSSLSFYHLEPAANIGQFSRRHFLSLIKFGFTFRTPWKVKELILKQITVHWMKERMIPALRMMQLIHTRRSVLHCEARASYRVDFGTRMVEKGTRM